MGPAAKVTIARVPGSPDTRQAAATKHVARQVSVLFVCTGNICRSPTAEGVFRKLVADAGLAEHVQIDSAGTHAYHVGEAPTLQAQHTAAAHGFSLAGLRARVLTPEDCLHYDRLLVMDRGHLNRVTRMCAATQPGKVRLFMEYAPQRREREVPDPYGGTGSDYEYVFGLIHDAARGLLADVEESLDLRSDVI